MLFTANVFCQSVFDMFLCDAEYVTTGDGLRKHHITTYTSDWCPVTYQFIVNGKQYLVSYEQCEDCKDNKTLYGKTKQRNLYLYRWDSIEWNIAVDKPLRVDIFGYDENWNLTCDCYFPQMYGGNWFYLKDVKGRKNYNSGIGLVGCIASDNIFRVYGLNGRICVETDARKLKESWQKPLKW